MTIYAKDEREVWHVTSSSNPSASSLKCGGAKQPVQFLAAASVSQLVATLTGRSMLCGDCIPAPERRRR